MRQIGSRVAGRYRLVAPLGEGGSASTFRAFDEAEGRFVALKLLHSVRPELEAALLGELELLGRLMHPRIAEVLHFGRAEPPDARLFYASRLVDGAELAKAPSWERARSALTDALEALAFLHGHGVRHGDLTPENVLLERDGGGALIDFGAAAPIGEARAEVSGALAFVAPEVLRGEAADGRADLYAFGKCVDALEATLGPAPADLSEVAAACRRPLGARPSGAAEVLERLGEPARARALLSAEAPRLLGRDAALERFDATLAALIEGRPSERAIALVGPPGSGRTRLLRELERRALAVAALVDVHPRQAAALDRLLGASEGAVTDVLSRLREAGGPPRVWGIDDADALEPRERRRLDAIARALEPTDPVLLLAVGELPGHAVRAEPLEPLDEASVREWAEGHVDPAAMDGLVARSGGHPGTVRRLLGGVDATGQPGDGAARATAGLSARSVELLAWLAASGRAWSTDALRGNGLAVEEAPELLRRGWLKAEAGALALARPADATDLLATLAPDAVTSLHERLARVTEGPDAIVHALRAGDEAAARARLAEARDDAPGWRRAAGALLEARARDLRSAGADVFVREGMPDRALPALLALSEEEPTEARAAQLASCQLKLEQTEAVLETLSRCDRTVRVVDLYARALIKRGAYAEALGALEALDERDDPRIQESIGVAKSYLGRDDAAEHLRAAARSLGDARPADRVRVDSYLGIDAYRRGELEEAGEAYRRALERASRHRLEDGIASAALNLGTVLHQRGDYGDAAAAYARAHRMAVALDQRATLATGLLNEAQLFCDVGAWDRAEAAHARARAAAEEAGAALLLAACGTTRAEIAMGRSRPDAALEALEDAADRFTAQGAERELAELRCHRADALRMRGDLDEASAVLSALDAEPLARDLAVRRALVRGRLALSRGDAGAATDAFERAAAEADAAGLRAVAASAHAGLARGWASRATPALAERHAREARERWERCAAGLPRALRETFWAHPDRQLAPASTPPRAAPREAQLERLIALNRSLVSTTELDGVLRRALDAAIELTGAERGFLILNGPRGLEVPVARNLDRERIGRSHLKFSRSIAERVMETSELLITVDAKSDERFASNASVHAMKLRSVIAAPISSPDGALGALYLDNRFLRDRFGEVDHDLVRAFADHVGIAIRNARLVEALRERTEELERERARVAAESEARATTIVRLQTELARGSRPHRFGEMIADAPAMRPVLDVLDKVVDSPLSVLVQGESGTGKELVARAVHEQGPHLDGPFVSVNCAALPDALLESELFGHVRGAFTGAERDRAGLMAQAEGGTLFLDEIGETSAPMQAKLLRALEERVVRPVGGSEERPVRFRLVCATNRDLETEAGAGRFREDLYYRIGVVTIRLPPLRERLEDLPALARAILAGASDELGRGPMTLSSQAVRRLLAAPWPGNIRQLQNVLRRAAVLCEDGVIDVEHLSLGRREAGPPTSRGERDAREKARILEALATTDWNVTAAAARAGVSRATIYRKMRAYGLTRSRSVRD